MKIWIQLDGGEVFIPGHNVKKKGINYVGGGNSMSRLLDLSRNLDDFVRLSFCDDHPMMYRLQNEGANLCLLEIDLSVVNVPGVMFSNMNATDNQATVQSGIDGLKAVNLDATQRHFVRKEDEDFKPHQAEILVPKVVPLKYIKNLEQVKRYG